MPENRYIVRPKGAEGEGWMILGRIDRRLVLDARPDRQSLAHMGILVPARVRPVAGLHEAG